MESRNMVVRRPKPKSAYRLHKESGGNFNSYVALYGSILVTICLVVYVGSGVGHTIGFDRPAKSYSDLFVDFGFIAGIVWIVKKLCDGWNK